MKRHLLGLVAAAAVASFAGAQQPATHGDSVSATHRMNKKAKKVRYTSSGEIDRGGPGYSLRATKRDWVGAENTAGDDLFKREQMMDAKCGKDRDKCGRKP